MWSAYEPIDKVKFQNSVRQHLEEDPDFEFNERWDLMGGARSSRRGPRDVARR